MGLVAPRCAMYEHISETIGMRDVTRNENTFIISYIHISIRHSPFSTPLIAPTIQIHYISVHVRVYPFRSIWKRCCCCCCRRCYSATTHNEMTIWKLHQLHYGDLRKRHTQHTAHSKPASIWNRSDWNGKILRCRCRLDVDAVFTVLHLIFIRLSIYIFVFFSVGFLFLSLPLLSSFSCFAHIYMKHNGIKTNMYMCGGEWRHEWRLIRKRFA